MMPRFLVLLVYDSLFSVPCETVFLEKLCCFVLQLFAVGTLCHGVVQVLVIDGGFEAAFGILFHL